MDLLHRRESESQLRWPILRLSNTYTWYLYSQHLLWLFKNSIDTLAHEEASKLEAIILQLSTQRSTAIQRSVCECEYRSKGFTISMPRFDSPTWMNAVEAYHSTSRLLSDQNSSDWALSLQNIIGSCGSEKHDTLGKSSQVKHLVLWWKKADICFGHLQLKWEVGKCRAKAKHEQLYSDCIWHCQSIWSA